MSWRRRYAPKGFTLVEIMVALAILAVALVAILMILEPLNRNVGDEITTNDLDINANRVVTDVLDRVRPGRLLPSTDSTRGMFSWGDTFVKYVVPVDGTGGGFFVTPVPDGTKNRMVMVMGGNHPDAIRTTNPPHGFPYYLKGDFFNQFGPETADENAIKAITAKDYQFYEVIRWVDSGQSFSEVEHDLDVDGDGIKNRSFKLGRIELYFPPATAKRALDFSTPSIELFPATRVALSPDNVLWDPDTTTGRRLPPIFSFGGYTYRVDSAGARINLDSEGNVISENQNRPPSNDTLFMSLTVVGFGLNGQAFTTRVRSQVSLRNQNLEWINPNLYD